jgi:hypothetical protein
MIQGFLEIFDATQTPPKIVFSGSNIITKGMGYALANLFTEQEDQEVSNFQIGYFQIGVSSVGFEPYSASSSFYQLSSGITKAQYGTNLDSEVKTLSSLGSTKFVTLSSINLIAPSAFVSIDNSKLSKGVQTSNKYKIYLDKNMAVGVSATEFGLFIKNPNVNYKIDKPMLAAYKKLNTPLVKSSENEFIFQWTIKIIDISE